jgi:hypothetical protein
LSLLTKFSEENLQDLIAKDQVALHACSDRLTVRHHALEFLLRLIQVDKETIVGLQQRILNQQQQLQEESVAEAVVQSIVTDTEDDDEEQEERVETEHKHNEEIVEKEITEDEHVDSAPTLPYSKLFADNQPARPTFCQIVAKNATGSSSDAIKSIPVIENIHEVVRPEVEAEPEAEYERHPEDLICRKWNRGECFKGSHCQYYHECLQCGGPHTSMKCPFLTLANGTAHTSSSIQENEADSTSTIEDAVSSSTNILPTSSALSSGLDIEPCIKWNHRDCFWGSRCHRAHVCLHCGSEDHRCDVCPEDVDEEVCLNWNHGRCRMGERCKRSHRCALCGSGGHCMTDCTETTSSTSGNLASTNATLRTSRVARWVARTSGSAAVSRATSTDRKSSQGHVTASDVCLNWNNGRCGTLNNTTSSGSDKACRRQHICSICNSPQHPAISCPSSEATAEKLLDAGVDVCLNWNRGRCSDSASMTAGGRIGNSCKRLHVCQLCYSPDHKVSACPSTTLRKDSSTGMKSTSTPFATSSTTSNPAMFNKSTTSAPNSGVNSNVGPMMSKSPSMIKKTEICVNWNQQRCRLGDRCKRLHQCLECGSTAHTAFECTQKPLSAVPERQSTDQHQHQQQQQQRQPVSPLSASGVTDEQRNEGVMGRYKRLHHRRRG